MPIMNDEHKRVEKYQWGSTVKVLEPIQFKDEFVDNLWQDVLDQFYF